MAGKASVIGKAGEMTPNGREGKWELRHGAVGKGRLIQAVTFWPWSGRSVEEAEKVIAAAAERAGVTIIDGDVWRS